MIIIFENKEEETNYRFCDLWRKSTFVAVKNGEKYDIDRSRYGERLKSIDEKTLVQEIEKTITWTRFEKLSPDFPKKVLFTKKRKPFEMANSKIIEGNLEVELNDYGNIFYRIDGEWYHFREIEILTRF
jgi:hypothetical protein